MPPIVAWVREDLREIRLLLPSGERSWRAPALAKDATDAFSLRARAEEAAVWTAEQCAGAGSDRVGIVCVDVEDAACVFVSAPAQSQEVIAAAMRQSAVEWDDLGLLGRPQALVAPERAQARRRGVFGIGGDRSESAGAARTTRAVVLSEPDSLVRLWLYGLDTRGIDVGVAVSVWHAAAQAWLGNDIAAAKSASESGKEDADDAPVEAVVEPPLRAVVLQCADRLVWSWARGGSLVAGGEIATPRTAGVDAASAEQTTPEDAPRSLTPHDRLAQGVSRLTLDWLAWSTNLGVAPEDIAVVGPDAGDLATLLRERATDTAITEHDAAEPVIASLRRLASADADQTTPDDDPRRALVMLTRRRGRAHQKLYTWAGVTIGLLAVAVGVLGWRERERASSLREAAAEYRAAARQRVAAVAPELATDPNPARALESRFLAMRGQDPEFADPAPVKPVFSEIGRLITSLNQVGAEIMEMQIDERNPVALVRVPSFEAGEAIEGELRRTPGLVRWSANFERQLGAGVLEWRLRGQWQDSEAVAAANARAGS